MLADLRHGSCQSNSHIAPSTLARRLTTTQNQGLSRGAPSPHFIAATLSCRCDMSIIHFSTRCRALSPTIAISMPMTAGLTHDTRGVRPKSDLQQLSAPDKECAGSGANPALSPGVVTSNMVARHDQLDCAAAFVAAPSSIQHRDWKSTAMKKLPSNAAATLQSLLLLYSCG